MKIGITGKIGSGKSSLAKALSKELQPLGYELVDVDDFTARCYQEPAFQAEALRIFGSSDRAGISKAVFGRPDLRAALERASLPFWSRLLHGSICKENLILDFPLLLETQLALPDCDLLVGVDASRDIRSLRARGRLGWDSERFDRVDALQVGSRAKMSFCDLSFSNDAEPAALRAQACRLAGNIKALGAIQGRLFPLLGKNAWRNIARAHCEPHRRYHGATHLQALFDHIDPAFASDPACALAIAYHDFHYETGANYALNESRSCLALSRDSRDHFPGLSSMPELDGRDTGAVALACALIDCTKGHQIRDPWLLADPSRLARAQAFLDADLSVLGGSPQEAFHAYDAAIGEEFIHVDRPLYHRLRAQAMGSFLDATERPSIYFTERCSPWEAVARARLGALVDKHAKLADNPSSTGSKRLGAPS